MKDTLKFSYKLFICVLLVALLCFIVVISVGLDSPELVVIDAQDQPIEYNASAVSFMGNFCSVATTFFLCVMVYHHSWNQGFKDYNRKYSQPTVHYTLKGFVCGFIAVLPILIIGALALADKSSVSAFIYKIVVAPFIYWYNIMLKNGNYIFCQFVYLIVPVVSGVSYIMGKHNFLAAKRIVYGKKYDAVQTEKPTSAMDIMNEKNRNNLK